MSFLGKLFGSDNVISAGIATLDSLVHTDEEDSQAKRAFLKLYEPFKLAQRYIAMTFCPVYVFAWLLTFITELLSAVWGNTVKLDKVYSLLSGDMANCVIIILVFYFGGGMAEGAISRFKKPQ